MLKKDKSEETLAELIRNARKEMNVADNVKTNLFVETSNKDIKANLECIKKLANGKEISLIKYLFDNCSASKNDLLKDIWGYNEEMETKVLENTINKIKQKFKSANITNFIISDNGKYKINTIYKQI